MRRLGNASRVLELEGKGTECVGKVCTEKARGKAVWTVLLASCEGELRVVRRIASRLWVRMRERERERKREREKRKREREREYPFLTHHTKVL